MQLWDKNKILPWFRNCTKHNKPALSVTLSQKADQTKLRPMRAAYKIDQRSDKINQNPASPPYHRQRTKQSFTLLCPLRIKRTIERKKKEKLLCCVSLGQKGKRKQNATLLRPARTKINYRTKHYLVVSR